MLLNNIYLRKLYNTLNISMYIYIHIILIKIYSDNKSYPENTKYNTSTYVM